MQFKLNEDFLKEFQKKKPDFGFNGLGELVYMRTYSRVKEDGTNEKWWETCKRVVEGAYSLQGRHILKYELGWDVAKAQESAQEMYERMFDMKFLPPGRGLWAMGTDITEKRDLFAALNNCAFVSTDSLHIEPTKPFEFLMDMSMLGVGVGFDVKGAGLIQIYQPIEEHKSIFTIPDTREGWVEAVKLQLLTYFVKDSERLEFDYSLIRKEGTPIKTFGGKASGPGPLKQLLDRIAMVFDNRHGDTITQTDITDIMNMIGACVVAGNVRRTAEIVFGEADSEEYLKLKDYRWDATQGAMVGEMKHRSEWGWTSNNSVFAKVGMDYKRVGDQTAVNGEPGYAWLDNMQKFGRMADPINNKDHKAKGGNPCLEQTLESFELCCLVETFPTRHTSIEDYERTLKFAYLYAKTVTLGRTHWSETNRVMLRNRRIGTSMSGVAQYLEKYGIDQLKQLCERGYAAIQKYDEIYSDWLCIPRSIKTTSIKPSGTVSLLPGVTPGMHWPEDNYYIRRVTLSKSSELVQQCLDAGYKIEPSNSSPETSVIVEIPVAIEGVRTVDEVTLWEQVSLAAFLQKYWADNQVSSTVTFKPADGDQIKHALNYFQYDLKGISFLPKLEAGAYPQMPYEGVSKERYLEIKATIKELNFDGIAEDSAPELYCDGDHCTIN
jgi:ribonucleoside-triphosphate reductase